jgi:hypothetical protein
LQICIRQNAGKKLTIDDRHLCRDALNRAKGLDRSTRHCGRISLRLQRGPEHETVELVSCSQVLPTGDFNPLVVTVRHAMFVWNVAALGVGCVVSISLKDQNPVL